MIKASGMINPIERITRDRIIQLFKELGYTYYGNWEEGEGNSNLEEKYLRPFLHRQGYASTLVSIKRYRKQCRQLRPT